MLNSIYPINDTMYHPILDNSLSFHEYITKTRAIVEDRRIDLQQVPHEKSTLIINANTPFEFFPKNPIKTAEKLKYGALLIHGLFDCPFSLRDIGLGLQEQGILARSILLPGHGTTPKDLLNVHFQDWIEAVRYGIDSFKDQVEHLFLIGYSTGATLSLFHAMENTRINGTILLSPAIRIKPPFDAVLFWQQLRRLFAKKNSDWVCIEDEIDYTKYQSIPFNAVFQLTQLTDLIANIYETKGLKQPFLMVVSREDETISSHHAVEFFNYARNDRNKLLLYTATQQISHDPRVIIRHTHENYESIKHFSHVAIPFAPDNSHYGKAGDFIYASLADQENFAYGAYNIVEQRCFDFLCRLGLIKNRRRALTYNPDFDFMSEQILKFIFENA